MNKILFDSSLVQLIKFSSEERFFLEKSICRNANQIEVRVSWIIVPNEKLCRLILTIPISRNFHFLGPTIFIISFYSVKSDRTLRGNHWICNLRKSSDIVFYYKRAPSPSYSTFFPLPRRKRREWLRTWIIRAVPWDYVWFLRPECIAERIYLWSYTRRLPMFRLSSLYIFLTMNLCRKI